MRRQMHPQCAVYGFGCSGSRDLNDGLRRPSADKGAIYDRKLDPIVYAQPVFFAKPKNGCCTRRNAVYMWWRGNAVRSDLVFDRGLVLGHMNEPIAQHSEPWHGLFEDSRC